MWHTLKFIENKVFSRKKTGNKKVTAEKILPYKMKKSQDHK